MRRLTRAARASMKRVAAIVLLCPLFSGLEINQAIRTDGMIGVEEWKDAEVHQVSDSNSVYLITRQEVIYVALKANKKIWAHVYISNGNQVKVIHASSALDDVIYRREGCHWTTKDSFQFELADKTYNSDTEAAMGKYFERNGWVANNVSIGDAKTLEFKIDLSCWEEPVYLACVMAEYDMKLHSFPPKLNDDAVRPGLVLGYTPDSLQFEPAKWHRLR